MGPATVYLDTNIIRYMMDGDCPELRRAFSEESLIAVISEITISEISGHDWQNRRQFLESIGAMISYALEKPDEIGIRQLHPLSSYSPPDDLDSYLQDALLRDFRIFIGGENAIKRESLEGIAKEKISEILKIIDDGGQSLPADIASAIEDFKVGIQDRLSRIDFPDQRTLLSDFQSDSPRDLSLSSITPPAIAKKIERKLRERETSDFTLFHTPNGYSQFPEIAIQVAFVLFGLKFSGDKQNRPANSDDAKSLAGTRSVMNDAQHIAAALGTTALLSADKGLLKAAFATYEHLGEGPVVLRYFPESHRQEYGLLSTESWAQVLA